MAPSHDEQNVAKNANARLEQAENEEGHDGNSRHCDRDSEGVMLSADACEACCLCCEDTQHWAVGPCGHRIACAVCAIRLRMLMNSTLCVVCKRPQPYVVVTSADCAFEDFDASTMLFDSNFSAFFAEEHVHAHMMSLTSITCGQCSSLFPAVGDLQQHLMQAHGLQMCDLRLSKCIPGIIIQ